MSVTQPLPSTKTGSPFAAFAFALILIVLFGWPLVINDQFLLHVGTMLSLYSIGAMSLHLIIRTGHVSLGQAAFLGLSSYTCALLVMKLQVPWPIAALCGVAVSAGFGAIVAPVFLRLSGKYFVLITFMFSEIVRLSLSQAISITGGANGLISIPPPFDFLVTKFNYYYFALIFAVICVSFAIRLLASDFGRAIDSIGESKVLAESTGMPVAKINRFVFVIACGMIGVQGAVQAHYIRYLEPNAFGTVESLNLVVMNVIGGMTSVLGPILGAIFVIVLPEVLRDYVMVQKVVFGICLVVVMAALPGGLAQLIIDGWTVIRRRWGA